MGKKARSLELHSLADKLKQKMLRQQMNQTVEVLWESPKSSDLQNASQIRYEGYTPNFCRVETYVENTVLLESRIKSTRLLRVVRKQSFLNRKYTMIKIPFASALIIVLSILLVSGCTDIQSPKQVSKKFWEAVQKRDMETAKQLSTWESVDYLKYLKVDKLHPERFELGEEMLGEDSAQISTTLYTSRQGQSGVKVPGVTVLVKIEQGWRVDVKQTLSTVVKETVNNVFEQLNGLMQEGVSELDKVLSESMSELGKALDQGAKELRKELNKPIFPQPSSPQSPSIQPQKSIGL